MNSFLGNIFTGMDAVPVEGFYGNGWRASTGMIDLFPASACTGIDAFPGRAFMGTHVVPREGFYRNESVPGEGFYGNAWESRVFKLWLETRGPIQVSKTIIDLSGPRLSRLT